MSAPPRHSKKAFISAVVGTVLVALCCLTPVLVLVLSLLGVSFLIPYLDYVLFPALVVVLTCRASGYRQYAPEIVARL